jgi:hypothetical protein
MPLQATSGAASYDAFGGGVAAEPNYIESVFSTYLYTGNGSTQTITNGIDLSTKGGLVWIKDRTAANSNVLFDTVRGANKRLISNLTNAESTETTAVTAFNNNGFSIGSSAVLNTSSNNLVSWTFREQPKFFDVVTWTGTGANRTIAHALGSVPACIMVKRTDATADWQVYHRSMGNTQYLVLNSAAAAATGATRWNSTTPTSTVFSIGTDTTVNASGGTYVAYIFAHDSGGFGLLGTDNVISCGSYTGNDAAIGTFVNVGFEPQWLLIKASVSPDNTQDWRLVDNMRGIPMSDQDMILAPNSSAAETDSNTCNLDARGFYPTGPNYNANGFTYIYIAIRRGPMKVPTTGTSVFLPHTAAVATGGVNITTNFVADLTISHENRAGTGSATYVTDRLRGSSSTSRRTLLTASTAAEATSAAGFYDYAYNTSLFDKFAASNSWAAGNFVDWIFKRAPSFMDVVAYNRTSSAAVTHNLGVTPELLIIKRRGGVEPWGVMRPNTTGYLLLNATDALSTGLSATATSTTFTIGSGAFDYTDNYVVYLFATCAGVSKVGSYTGTATTKQIDCGFTAGARFVLIKKTSGTGSWYVWDSARGIVSGNDPYLLLNSTAAEVTNTDYIDTYSAGFEISSTAPSEINENGGSFIFFAVS